jgi:DNA (cytosine-5)-methyltransferase 1
MLSQSGSNGQRVAGLFDPMGTITTARGGERALCIPWLTKYYGTGSVQPTGKPIDTVTTKDRFGLAMASLVDTMRELRVVDIGFRMLAVEELLRAQGFPDGYMLFGAKHEQVRQVGNAVCPPVAEALCRTIQEAA